MHDVWDKQIVCGHVLTWMSPENNKTMDRWISCAGTNRMSELFLQIGKPGQPSIRQPFLPQMLVRSVLRCCTGAAWHPGQRS